MLVDCDQLVLKLWCEVPTSKIVYYFRTFVFSSRRRHTRCALVTGVQTCALPIFGIDNFTPYYSVNLKHARVAHLEARYGEPFTFIDVDFGDANALAEVLDRKSTRLNSSH